MSIKFLVLGGGVFWVFGGGGGGVPILFFMGARIFLTLARNQYINNSPGIFSCIRAGANAGATCIRTELVFLQDSRI